jgi:hypothetical protein
MWEHEMRRLRLASRVLVAVAVAVAVRVIVSGLTVTTGLSLVVIGLLLGAVRLLIRQGRRLQPPGPPDATRADPSPPKGPMSRT